MFEEYPIEIQIKTKEEYITHKSIHALKYKNNNFNEKTKSDISFAVFPLIEVLAYKLIYLNYLPEINIEKCDKDLK